MGPCVLGVLQGSLDGGDWRGMGDQVFTVLLRSSRVLQSLGWFRSGSWNVKEKERIAGYR